MESSNQLQRLHYTLSYKLSKRNTWISGSNSTLYLTASSDPNYITPGGSLWQIDESTGRTLETMHFDHYVLPPIEIDNKVAVAADLQLILLTGSSSSINFQIVIAAVIAVTIIALLVVIILLKESKSIGERKMDARKVQGI